MAPLFFCCSFHSNHIFFVPLELNMTHGCCCCCYCRCRFAWAGPGRRDEDLLGVYTHLLYWKRLTAVGAAWRE